MNLFSAPAYLRNVSSPYAGWPRKLATVAGLNVHIAYLREMLKGHDERIRALEAGR